MEYNLSYTKELESEAIYLIREAAAQFSNCVLLFSGGKDSIVLLHLARKAFWPSKIPFSILHIDTGHNFPETIEFRDKIVKDLGVNLIVRYVQDSIDNGRVREEKGPNKSRNALQSVTLLDAINELKIDVALGGGRRDEEKARAKERFFSHRDEFGQWNPKNQRPELWNLFNGKKKGQEHFRVFPLSNWTEIDIWRYIQLENLEIPGLYFSHQRRCIIKNGTILASSKFMSLEDGDTVKEILVRFRTIGDMTCTGATISEAKTVQEIIKELETTRIGERGVRTDDKTSESSMEDRKKEGYF